MSKPKIGFEPRRITLPLEKILPIRAIKDPDKKVARYRAIVASIREVGVVESLMVHPQKGSEGLYLLMDGHLRLYALRELGIPEAECLVALEDESFTYNARVNRLPAIQEHKMITKAVRNGVPVERIAAALNLRLSDIRARLNLLQGIGPEAVEILKDKPVAPAALAALRKVKAIRQIEIAELMVGANNYTKGYAAALLLGTSKEMLIDPDTPKTTAKISREELARLEAEVEKSERDYKAVEENYAENMLNLTVLRGYVRKLLANARIVKFLGSRHGELLAEFERIAATEEV